MKSSNNSPSELPDTSKLYSLLLALLIEVRWILIGALEEEEREDWEEKTSENPPSIADLARLVVIRGKRNASKDLSVSTGIGGSEESGTADTEVQSTAETQFSLFS